MRWKGCMAAVVGTVCAMAYPASGSLITWEYGGIIDTVTDPTNVLGGQVRVGEMFHGTVTFNPTTLDTYPDPTIGIYTTIAMQADIDTLHLDVPATDPARVWVGDNSYSDSLSVGAGTFQQGSLWIAEFYVLLDDDQAAVFGNDALPVSPPDLFQFEWRRLNLVGDVGADRFDVKGTVTYLTPEPGALAMLLLGYAGVLQRRR